MTTLTLQPDGTSGIDTFITAPWPTYNWGARGDLLCGGSGNVGQPYRSLLKFTGLPTGVTIVSATLRLYCEAEVLGDDRNVSVHRSLVQWYEGVKTGATPDAGQDGSTWNLRNANGDVAWAGGAGGGSGSDYAAVATATTLITGTGTTFDWDVTADVTAWVGGTDNHGWFLIGDEGGTDRNKNFTSSDGGTAANRPKLIIEYTESEASSSVSPIFFAGDESVIFSSKVVGL